MSGSARRALLALAISATTTALMPSSAFAAASDRVVFTIKPVVLVQLVSSLPGESRFRVRSNAPFRITASDLVGPVKARVTQVSAKAQSPGPNQTCRVATGAMSSVIYRANRKTAAAPGRSMAQSVVVTLKYHKSGHPHFQFKPGERVGVPLAPSCISVDSSAFPQ